MSELPPFDSVIVWAMIFQEFFFIPTFFNQALSMHIDLPRGLIIQFLLVRMVVDR